MNDRRQGVTQNAAHGRSGCEILESCHVFEPTPLILFAALHRRQATGQDIDSA